MTEKNHQINTINVTSTLFPESRKLLFSHYGKYPKTQLNENVYELYVHCVVYSSVSPSYISPVSSFEQLRPSQYCHMQTNPLGHVHFSELQPVLQSQRNISSNVGSSGGKSVVLGSSFNSDYLHPPPHSIESNYFPPFSSFTCKYSQTLVSCCS